MVVAGLIWLLLIFYGDELFWPVIKSSGRFYSVMWTAFSNSDLI